MNTHDRIIIGLILIVSLIASVGTGFSLYATYGELNLVFLLIAITSGGMIGLIGVAAFEKFINL